MKMRCVARGTSVKSGSVGPDDEVSGLKSIQDGTEGPEPEGSEGSPAARTALELTGFKKSVTAKVCAAAEPRILGLNSRNLSPRK